MKKEELDEGYVTLVNAKEEDGNLTECEERTERWAWKHRHQNDGSVDYVEVKGEVVFNGVDFGYNDEKIVLHDIKLYAKPGQKIAFVGSTGAGKTTITNLINRFYDIQDGKIRYDGININKIIRKQISGVHLESFCRIHIYSPERCVTISALANWMRPMKKSWRPARACQCRQLYPPASGWL